MRNKRVWELPLDVTFGWHTPSMYLGQKAISDAGWGMFTRMLEYKAEWYGGAVVKIDRWYPSTKTCSGCGHVVDKLPLSTRTWTCSKCRAVHDRDVNAAKNILSVGYTVWRDGQCENAQSLNASEEGSKTLVAQAA